MARLTTFLFQDWKANSGNSKGRIVMLLFRMARFCAIHKIWYYIGLPYLVFYKVFVEWVLCIEIPWHTEIGKNCKIYHGQGLVINGTTVIGENCVLRHNTTIGNTQLKNGSASRSPVIGNNVDIGCHVCILGPIYIGNNVKIGAGAVVVKNVDNNCTVIGNPAKEVNSKVHKL